uniref:Gustatory receptor n=2 Tax=Anopheles albimanus TaxID=7167 RepID=A0A182FZN8_ANOAL
MCPSPERLFLSFLYYLNSILGLNPYVLDRHGVLRFRANTLKRYWSFAIGNLTGILVLFSFYIVYDRVSVVNFLFIRQLVYVECLLRCWTITSCYYQIFYNNSRLLPCVNRLLRIVQQTTLAYSKNAMNRTFVPIVLKVLCIDVILSLVYLKVNMLTPEPSLQYNRAINIFFVLLGAQITNLVLLLLLFAARCYGSINTLLEATIRQLVPFETDCSFWAKRRVIRQQICCDVSDRLDDILALHQDLSELVRRIFRILQTPLLFITLTQFVVILSRIFLIYVTTAQRARHSISISRSINSTFYLTFEVCQCILITSAYATFTIRSRRTGEILNAYINASIDRRTEQSIERFSLALMTTDSRIRVAGLFELDLEFLYSLIATTTSYLIVLIQFQLKD